MSRASLLSSLFLGASLLLGACQCDQWVCPRTTCEAEGANCGEIEDGCGGTLDCGFCSGGLSCGGGGVENVCGGRVRCTAATCTELSAQCGTTSDGCGAELDCGYCRGGATCGGAGTANTCGALCTPATCASLGANCGFAPDGCGGVLDCGGLNACGDGQNCGGGGRPNRCGSQRCTPHTCSGGYCGLTSNGCDDVLRCGSCSGGQVCAAGGSCADAAGSIGAACTGPDTCPAGICLLPGQGGWPGGFCTAFCSADTDCGAGNRCILNGAGLGICAPICGTDADCPRAGYGCYDVDGDGTKECAPFGDGGGQIGDPCVDVGDCAGGADAICLDDPNLPTNLCASSCADGQTCPPGSVCTFDGEGAVCLATCQTTSECPEGAVCEDRDGDGVFECGPGQGIGDPCEDGTQCASGECIPESAGGAPGGFCTAPCTTDGDCPPGSECGTLPGGGTGCASSCASDSDCPGPGWACDPAGYCTPYGGGDGQVGDACEDVSQCAGGSDASCIPDGTGGSSCTVSCGEGDPCPPGSACNGAFCERTCIDDTDCREGTHCEQGLCAPGTSVGGDVGTACQVADDCAGQTPTCITETVDGWPGGYCSLGCVGAVACPTGAHCGLQQSAGDVSFGSCLLDCKTDSDCRPEYKCWDFDSDGQKECAPYGSGSGQIGDPCASISDCAGQEEAECLTEFLGFPRGYCTQRGDCRNYACPDGSRCSEIADDEFKCMDKGCCTQFHTCSYEFPGGELLPIPLNDDCPAGTRCAPYLSSARGHCVNSLLPNCDPRHSCPDGFTCTHDGLGWCMKCAGGDRCRDDYTCFDRDKNGGLLFGEQRECWPSAKGGGNPGAAGADDAGGRVGGAVSLPGHRYGAAYRSRLRHSRPGLAG